MCLLLLLVSYNTVIFYVDPSSINYFRRTIDSHLLLFLAFKFGRLNPLFSYQLSTNNSVPKNGMVNALIPVVTYKPIKITQMSGQN